MISNSIITFSGLGLIAASGVLQSRRAKESSAKKAFRWSVALIGLGMTCYGGYHLVNQIFEQKIVAPASCRDRLEQAKKEFLSCPDAKKLWKEVESKGSFTFKCVSAEHAPFGGRLDVLNREIYISDKADKIIENLTLEMSNLKRAETFINNADNACSGTVDQFVKQVETNEYRSIAESINIHNSCRSGGFWQVGESDFQKQFTERKVNNWSTLEGYLATQEKVGHSDLLRGRWYQKCDPEGHLAFLLDQLLKKEEL